jgi:hypothetical protein
VEVQVEDRLTCTGSRIHNHTIRIVYPLLYHQFGDNQMDMSDEFPILGIDILESSNGFSGNYQEMHGCLGIHIPESDAMFILMDDIRGYLFVDNLSENGIAHGEFLLRREAIFVPDQPGRRNTPYAT